MPFVNGFATEEDIKIKLFTFEPEQLSDLILVPLPEDVAVLLSGLFYLETDTYSFSTYQGWLNLPFAYNITSNGRIQPDLYYPALFQRFNPFNKPFADEYSKKLFDFYFQFSNHYIYRRFLSNTVKVNSNQPESPRDLPLISLYNDYDFSELTLSLPNNNLVVELSYYYAEITDFPNVLFANWNEVYYHRHANECLVTQLSRQWLLQFESGLGFNDKEIVIKDNILIGSLVINFIDNPGLELYWSNEDKEYVLSQIPDYYLYSNLDDFFNFLTNEIIDRIPHGLENIEFLNQRWNRRTYGYNLSGFGETINLISASSPLNLKAGLLIYANNNNWNNNYDWVDNNNSNNTVYQDYDNLINLKIEPDNFTGTTEDETIVQINRISISLFPYSSGLTASDRPFFFVRNQGFNEYFSNNTYYQQERRNVISHWRSSNILAFLIYDYNISSQFIHEYGEKGTGFVSGAPVYDYYYLKQQVIYFNYSYLNQNYEDSAFDSIITPEESALISTYTDELNSREIDYKAEEYIFATELKELFTEEYLLSLNNQVIEGHENCYMANCDLEDIKKEVREIHAALDAGKFAYLDGSTENQRVSNLGYYVERIARVLGISVNSDGSIRSIRQSKIIDKGDTIPSGWNIAQWGRNNGASEQGQEGGLETHEKDGIAWEIKSNKFVVDDFTGEPTAIAQGGYALVENIPQLLHLIFEDLDRAFGLQDAGANVVPSPDGNQIVSYEGINTMLLDILYMLSQMSKNTSGAHISSLKNQAMLQEIFAALGLPTTINEILVNVSKDENVTIPVPGTISDSPTLMDMFMIVLINLSLLVGGKIEIKEPEE